MDCRRLGTLAQWHVVQPTAAHPGLGLACSCGRCPRPWVVCGRSAAGCNSGRHPVCTYELES
eukprot:15447869-Alexandrium_andersonii.AAC.1